MHTLVCLGTLEERIDRLITDKGVLAERVVGNGEGWLTGLSTDDLRSLLSLKAGGTGLNLTAANHVVHVDRWWNPATEAQATDRAYRIGQDRDVQVHTLVCLGTLEERIDRLILDKGVLAERVVGNGEGWLTGLTTDDLRSLLELAPEAVGE